MPGNELFGAEEKKEVQDVLDSGILFRYNFENDRNGHWKAREFERELAAFTGAKHAHACSSGSTAVSIALAINGIGHGDEVIVPPFTYVATIEAVLLAGAKPKFTEIDETLCLSPEGIQAALTPETKAVVLVHMCGAMAKLDEIVAICKERNVILIEDTAQALGASYQGKALGRFGTVGSFSFDFFKIITCGEGGALITDDDRLYELAHQYADHGHDHVGTNRGAEGHPITGMNYRIGELNAAVGLAQLRKMPRILEKQRAHKKLIEEMLRQFPQVTFRELPDPEGDSATFFNFFLPDEETTRRAVQALGERNAGGVAYWMDNNYHYLKNWEHFKEMKSVSRLAVQDLGMPQDLRTLPLPKSDDVVGRLLSIVIQVTWTDEALKTHLQKIEDALKSVLS